MIVLPALVILLSFCCVAHFDCINIINTFKSKSPLQGGRGIMATVTQQEVSPLHKHLNITINKEDYLPSFEKSLKDYSKKANIPGFRKGMVPTGLIRKMYGHSLFVDEVLRTVDREVISYIQKENLDIFAQPIPLEMNLAQLDVNKPAAYNFTFEVG